MTIMQAVANHTQSVASGDNTAGHVFSAAALGQALALIAAWGFSLDAVSVPDVVVSAFGVVFAFAVSVLLQKLAA